MAAMQPLRMGPVASSLFPRLAFSSFATTLRSTFVAPQHSRLSLLPAVPQLAVAVPGLVHGISGLLGDIWEGILKAVPKKKTSHMKKRHRQMAGKALKDVTSLNKCPACGEPKRMHRLCLSCMQKIQGSFPNTSKDSPYW